MARQRFVDAVVDDLLNKVIGAGGIGVHAGAFSDRIKTGEYFYSIGVVTVAHKLRVLKRAEVC
jgi:hypothetical protein